MPITQPAETDSESSTRTRMSSAGWVALVLLTGINLLNYIDRNIFAALMPAIKADLHFTDTELGLLGSGFIFSYLLISPVFGWLGDRFSRHKIMSAGIGFWSCATAFTGIASRFFTQMMTRISVGFGESGYTVIAPGTLADHFPKSARARVFSIYSAALPVGSALGYLLGGFLESRYGWRRSFFVVGIPGICLGLLLWFVPEPKRGASEVFHGPAPTPATRAHWWGDIRELVKNSGFVNIVLGYTAYTFVLGGLAFWMPSYIVRYYHVSLAHGNIVFGGVTVVAGLVGTLLGGWLADRLEKSTGNGYLKVCILTILFSFPLFFVTLGMTSFLSFSISMFFLEVALFLCTSPLDAAVLNFVRPEIRSMAVAVNVFTIHILGDGISRTLIGVISDRSSLRVAVQFFPWVLALAGVFWVITLIVYWQTVEWPKKAEPIDHRWRSHCVSVDSLKVNLPAIHPGELIHLHLQISPELGRMEVVNTLRRLLDQAAAQQVVISCEDFVVLRRFSQHCPRYLRALAISPGKTSLWRISLRVMFSRPHAVCVSDEGPVAGVLRSRGLPVIVGFGTPKTVSVGRF